MKSKSIKIAIYGVLISLAFLLSYIESLFPVMVNIPGVKLGLANLVVLCGLYTLGVKEAFVLSLLRILLVGFTFGNPSTMLFSMAGGILSWMCMALLFKLKKLGIVGVSITGGISHNIGQITVAMVVVNNVLLVYYLPVLLLTGAITGTVIGILGAIIVNTLKKSE